MYNKNFWKCNFFMANFVKYNFDLEPALKYNKVYKLKVIN